jgi:hypothetical protein
MQLSTRALVKSAANTMVLALAIYFGSGRLKHFDPMLLGYCLATLFACFGITYRYAVWLEVPATQVYWQRGWQLFFRRRGFWRHKLLNVRTLVSNLFMQGFVARRGLKRYGAHILIVWGCLISFAVTFPLVFGWVHFTALDDHTYRAMVFGIPAPNAFNVHSFLGWSTFHVLDYTAVMVIVGCSLALKRRFTDPGARALQEVEVDVIPLFMLIAISVTGLGITFTEEVMAGRNYALFALSHQAAVILFLVYLPFGKFFHIIQRPASIGVELYRQVASEDEQRACVRCGEPFASEMQIDDLRQVLALQGFDFELYEGGPRLQELFPPCKRVQRTRAYAATLKEPFLR